MATKFNDIVAMDLKVYTQSKVYFIHFIDLFARFSKAKVLRSKDPKVVVNAVVDTWIAAGMGAPRKILIDNGGEFDDNEYLEVMEQ